MAWDEMYYPKDEEGLGFRSLLDISRALHAKLWWRFRIAIGSLWATYSGNEYCKKKHPLMVHGIGASQTWKSMVKIKDKVEPYIWW